MRYWLSIVATFAAASILPLLASEMPVFEKADIHTRSMSALYSQELLDNLDCIKHTFRIKYAPKDWKFLLTGWDLDDQIAKAKSKVLEADTMNLDDGRQILMQFLYSCYDYHVKAVFHSTSFSYLPFRVKSSQGRYFVSWIDEKLLWERGMNLKVGDELISFNDRPVSEVVDELRSRHFNRGLPSTDNALAEIALTLRIGADGQNPQLGKVPLQALRRGRQIKGSLEWFYGDEEISPPFTDNYKALISSGSDAQSTPHSVFHKSMITPYFKSFVDVYKKINRLRGQTNDIIDDDFFPIGHFKSYVPLLGKILWKTSHPSTFNAYIFEHPSTKRPIGYVRIPSFDVQDEHNAKEFAYLIKEFEMSTDALVVDQVCNPGGDLFFAYAIASMLSKTPLVLPTHAFTITQKDVHEALNYLEALAYVDDESSAKETFGNSISGYNVDMDFVAGAIKHFQFVIDQWNAGHHITDQHHLYGITAAKPHPFATYSRPILMLIDSLDFSCADFLPAILQDNQRATLFGTRTSGAGGYVEMYSYPNLFGMSLFSCTASFAQRTGNNPLENLGVTPDIIYDVTPFDLQNEYSNYSKAVNKALETLAYPGYSLRSK
ncbi:MAG: protease-like activity factor CPAF [Parachlamydiaceae bacterium]|nr:protease-like activity factor CPAF [Parachlamydiaceae bacterium]